MKIGEFITGIAVVAFILSLCTIESLSAASLITMAVSGAWLVGYSYADAVRRVREGRR